MQTEDPRKWSAAKALPLIGLGVFLVALALRLCGITWGLPNDLRNQSLHPDELVVYSYSQSIDPAHGKFTPGFYNYGTLYLTALRVTTDVVTSYGAGPKDQSQEEFWRYVGRCTLAGRVLSSLAGAGIAWAVFAILFRRTTWIGALAGGLAIAFAPGMVVHSRFQTVDILATFFATMALLFALKLDIAETKKDAWKAAILSGVFAGLSAGTKYTGILMLVALAVVCLVLLRRKNPNLQSAVQLLGAGIGASLLTFFIVTPGALLESEAFIRDFKYEMSHTAAGHGLVFIGTANGFIYHIFNLVLAYGVLLLFMSLAGCIWAMVKRQPWMFALVATAVVYYILIGRAEVKFLRYVFPLLPPLACGFGWLIGESHKIGGMKLRIVPVLGIFALGGILGGGLVGSAQMTYWMVGEDPRDEAARYLQSSVAGVKTVGLVKDPWFWSVSVYPDAGRVRPQSAGAWSQFYQDVAQRSKPTAARYLPPNILERSDFDERLFSEIKPDSIAITTFEMGDEERLLNDTNLDEATKLEVDRWRGFSAKLTEQYDLKRIYGRGGPTVHDMMYIRPEVHVWIRKKDLPKPSTGSSTTSGSNAQPANTR